jgi:hypothetical protein
VESAPPRDGPPSEPAPPLHEHPALRALVLALAAVVAYVSAIDGELVWDDPAIIGAAARLSSPWAAFSRDLFDVGAGEGASYWRPLVTLSFALDLRVFTAAPAFGLHLVNLLWHALAAVLVGSALTRWARAETSRARLACWIAALLWTVLPAKAENVAWISGRGDVMGLALVLLGLWARRRLHGTAARAFATGLATALALLCKESFVAAPVLVAIELAAEHGEAAAGSMAARIRALLRAPEVLASAGVVAAYLVLRRVLLPIHGGGEEMFRQLSAPDRISLTLETLGHAFRALVFCHESHVLRGPIGFAAPFVLRRDPVMAAAGALGLLGLGALALRVPRARLAVALLLTLAPMSNALPAGLESRLSDRFLYVPSLAVALGVAVLLGAASARTFRAAGLALAAALAYRSSERAALFRSSDALWGWERAHGDRATSVLHNAANASTRAGRFEEARDRLLETGARYGELGFDEGYPYLVDAVRAQVHATGEAHAPSYAAYAEVLEGLLARRAGRVTVPFPNGTAIDVPTATPAAAQYAAAQGSRLTWELLVLRARAGSEEASARAHAQIDEGARGPGPLRDAARVELALAHPERAEPLIQKLRDDDEAEPLGAAARAQTLALRGGGDLGLARALFLGEAYGRACRAGAGALTAAAAPADRTLIALSCLLGGEPRAWQAIRPSLGAAAADLEREQVAWRNDPGRRLDLAAGR